MKVCYTIITERDERGGDALPEEPPFRIAGGQQPDQQKGGYIMMYRFIWEDDGEFVDDVVVSEFVAVRLLRAEGIEEADAGWLLKGRGAHLDTVDGYRLTIRPEG